jgi:hypothetical protein
LKILCDHANLATHTKNSFHIEHTQPGKISTKIPTLFAIENVAHMYFWVITRLCSRKLMKKKILPIKLFTSNRTFVIKMTFHGKCLDTKHNFQPGKAQNNRQPTAQHPLFQKHASPPPTLPQKFYKCRKNEILTQNLQKVASPVI